MVDALDKKGREIKVAVEAPDQTSDSSSSQSTPRVPGERDQYDRGRAGRRFTPEEILARADERRRQKDEEKGGPTTLEQIFAAVDFEDHLRDQATARENARVEHQDEQQAESNSQERRQRERKTKARKKETPSKYVVPPPTIPWPVKQVTLSPTHHHAVPAAGLRPDPPWTLNGVAPLSSPFAAPFAAAGANFDDPILVEAAEVLAEQRRLEEIASLHSGPVDSSQLSAEDEARRQVAQALTSADAQMAQRRSENRTLEAQAEQRRLETGKVDAQLEQRRVETSTFDAQAEQRRIEADMMRRYEENRQYERSLEYSREYNKDKY
ncbi:MAG: hypothetical protein IT384_20425 [Deltaproteobacteria bacterium]|nr:hypothetical protein [Deltaproteobacteria bacterium]